MTQIPAHIKALYKAPFRESWGYIQDAKNETVGWAWPRPRDRLPNSCFMTRGWGRIQYMENPEQLMKELNSILLAIVEPVKFDLTKCAAALTVAWEKDNEKQVPGHDASNVHGSESQLQD